MSVRAATGGALVLAASSVAAWALAYPQGSLSATLARAATDGAAVVTLGLAVVPMLDVGRHRGELARRANAPLIAASAVWLVTELIRLTLVAAETTAAPVGRLGVSSAVRFAFDTTAGRCGLISVAAAAVVGLVVAVAPSRATPAGWAVTSGVAAIGLSAHTLAGHLADSALGGAAIAVHTLAAALWCGTMAALVLTVEHRGQWARVLPRFAQLSMGCVAALLAAGVTGAVVRLDSPAQLPSTGYGRLLLAKVAMTAILLALAARNRSWWLPAARSHRATAGLSRSRAVTELAVMAVALTLAAALAVTG